MTYLFASAFFHTQFAAAVVVIVFFCFVFRALQHCVTTAAAAPPLSFSSSFRYYSLLLSFFSRLHFVNEFHKNIFDFSPREPVKYYYFLFQ